MPRASRIVVLDVVGGRFVAPAAWSLTEESGGWWTARRGERAEVQIHDVARLGDGRALCVVCGPRALVDRIAEIAGRVDVGLVALTADNTATARAMRRRWPWWRVTGTESDAYGKRTLVGEVRQLPTPLPTTALPWVMGPITVTALGAPAFPHTLAGWRDHDDAETGGEP